MINTRSRSIWTIISSPWICGSCLWWFTFTESFNWFKWKLSCTTNWDKVAKIKVYHNFLAIFFTKYLKRELNTE